MARKIAEKTSVFQQLVIFQGFDIACDTTLRITQKEARAGLGSVPLLNVRAHRRHSRFGTIQALLAGRAFDVGTSPWRNTYKVLPSRSSSISSFLKTCSTSRRRSMEVKRPLTFPLRLCPSVRAHAEALAKQDNISLNHFISLAVAEKLSRMEHESWLTARRPAKVSAPGQMLREQAQPNGMPMSKQRPY